MTHGRISARAGTLLSAAVGLLTAGGLGLPTATADNDDNTLVPNNSRLNNSVVTNVYTLQRQAGCTNDVQINTAAGHTNDVLDNEPQTYAKVDQSAAQHHTAFTADAAVASSCADLYCIGDGPNAR